MPESQFLRKNAEGLDEIRIGDADWVEAPLFTPEVKGPEGLQALLYGREALDERNPIQIPGYRWRDIRSKPRFRQVSDQIKSLVTSHPFIYYEPVELFRYTLPRNLVTYAFKGDRGMSASFLDDIRDGEYDSAIDQLPVFFQPFVERQMKSLINKIEDATVPNRYRNQSSGKVYEAWRDKRADSQFQGYFEEIVEDAARQPNATVIPPVPPILKRSGRDAIRRTRGYNFTMAEICESREESGVSSYLHFYLDQGIFTSESDNDAFVEQTIRQEIGNIPVSGVALTISNLETVWSQGYEKQLERFITSIANYASEEHLPVILPRSGWFGLHLTDHGVHSFSSLMNGNPTYNARGGGIDPVGRYGTVPIYGIAKELNASQLADHLESHGKSVHHVSGLEDSPPTFNERSSEIQEKFGNDVLFRAQFGKPRRLIHAQEARELRGDLKRGVANPAKRYLERSEHEQLS